MPLLIYLPLIVWTGMLSAMCEDTRPVPAKVRRDR